MPIDKVIEIASKNAVDSRIHSLSYRSEDVKGRLAEILIDLWNPERTLKSVCPTTEVKSLVALFPHFSKVIEVIDNSIFVSSLVEAPFKIGPILLQGEPGLGKTYFVKQLADLIGLPYFEISLATITASFALSGSSVQWSEGTVGQLAKIISQSPVANPIVLLDEVDKCREGNSYNPSNVLYSVLEPHTAKRFRDEALELELDLSHVIWVCTANYKELIPEPIISRMNVFEIAQPAPAKMHQVIKHMYLQFKESNPCGRLLDEELDEEVVNALSILSPRSIRINLEESSLKALRRGSNRIALTDIARDHSKESRRVGFI